MKPRNVETNEIGQELFDTAVRDRALVVVTVQDGAKWQTFKSRFLERDPQERFFVLDYQSIDGRDLPKLAPGQYIGASFRHRSRKVMFSTVMEAKGRFVLDNQSSIPAIRYRWPAAVTELQRRAYVRSIVPEDLQLDARGVIAGVSNPDRYATLEGRMVDLSCGGCLVNVDSNNVPHNWPENASVTLDLELPGDETVRATGNYRGTRFNTDGTSSVAVQFVGLEMSSEGQDTLKKLANAVQHLFDA